LGSGYFIETAFPQNTADPVVNASHACRKLIYAINESTGKQITIRSDQRLRSRADSAASSVGKRSTARRRLHVPVLRQGVGQPRGAVMNQVADALRAVGARMQQAIDVGQRPRAVDADDLVELLLAFADELDPPDRGAASSADPADQSTED
jgi:hypothetical protein